LSCLLNYRDGSGTAPPRFSSLKRVGCARGLTPPTFCRRWVTDPDPLGGAIRALGLGDSQISAGRWASPALETRSWRSDLAGLSPALGRGFGSDVFYEK